MIEVPAQFADWCARVDGEAGRAWARALPALARRLAGRWDLTLDDAPPLHGGQGLVVLARRGGQPVAVKLNRQVEVTADEVSALRAWGGRGAVALLDAEPDAGALLLERLDHSRSLRSLPLWEAAEVAGGLIRTLAVPAPSGLRGVRELAAGISAGLAGRQRALGDPVPPGWLVAAGRHADELGSAGEQLLIHADLHYDNVLAGSRQPWQAIDPRPLTGTPERCVPELIWSRADELRTDAEVRQLLDVLVRAGGLDSSIAYGWVVVRCVDYWLWGVEHGLTIDPARCERVLSALAPRLTG